jgi:hypothetical protein
MKTLNNRYNTIFKISTPVYYVFKIIHMETLIIIKGGHRDPMVV